MQTASCRFYSEAGVRSSSSVIQSTHHQANLEREKERKGSRESEREREKERKRKRERERKNVCVREKEKGEGGRERAFAGGVKRCSAAEVISRGTSLAR